MGDADDLDHAVAPRAVHDDMPWPVDPLAWLHPAAPKPQRICPHAGDFPDLVRAAQARGSTKGGEDGQHQPVVTARSLDAPCAGTREKDVVDLVFCRPKKAVAQPVEASLARLARKRSMARWWRASLSSEVETVT